MLPQNVIERFNQLFESTEIDPWTGCRLLKSNLQGRRASRAYGRLTVENKNYTASRLSYEIEIGPIPEGLCVLHECDTPACIEPSHLWVGTNLDNIRDKVEKGRQAKGERITTGRNTARGERQGRAKLTADNVRQIRALYAEGGISQETLGAMFGVSQVHISRVLRGDSWLHVTHPVRRHT
jgi:hypothetical protein